MSQIETAARRRQQIIDFLHLNPGATMKDIGELLAEDGVPRSRHHNSVRTMLEWREIRFEGAPCSRKYWANVITTRTADTVKQQRDSRIAITNGGRLETERRMAGVMIGRYIHTPGRNKNGMPGRGGQGALRQTVYVSCQT